MNLKPLDISVIKSMPKFLSLFFIRNGRMTINNDFDEVTFEMEQRMPQELARVVNNFYLQLGEGIDVREEGLDRVDERINNYLQRMGLNSVEVAKAVIDPSLEKVEKIARDIYKTFERFLGPNPFDRLDDIPFRIGESSTQQLENRLEYSEYVLGKDGKSFDDASKMSWEDIAKYLEKINEMRLTFERREHFTAQIAETYANSIIRLSIDYLKKKSQTIPPNEEDMARINEAFDYADKPKSAIADKFRNNSFNVNQMNILIQLVKMGEVGISIDDADISMDAESYAALIKGDLTVHREMRDSLVNLAQKDSLNVANTPKSIFSAFQNAYKSFADEKFDDDGSFDRYIDTYRNGFETHYRLINRIETSVLFQNNKGLITGLNQGIDDQVHNIADLVF